MRLDSLEPNAHYDMAHGEPVKLERDGDGSWLYRFNIAPEMDAETGETQIGWKCNEVRVWVEPTKSVLKRAIIRGQLDETQEFHLVNNYNKHVTKVKVSTDAVAEYKEYLQFTEDVGTMLDDDFD